MIAPWRVLLIGGARGVGKTRLGYALARHLGIGVTGVDDIQAAVERMMPPEQYPALHALRTDRAAFRRLDEEQQLAVAIGHAAALSSPLSGIIANHLGSGSPVGLEGDFLHPALAVQSMNDGVADGGQVRAVFVREAEEAQIGRDYAAREGVLQLERARASWRNGEWLCAEADRLGLPTVAARPWNTAPQRTLAAQGHPTDAASSVPDHRSDR